jgi:hypothetical protein
LRTLASRNFAHKAELALPGAFRDLASDPSRITLASLADLVLTDCRLVGLLAGHWHDGFTSPPFPGGPVSTGWRRLLFALLEHSRSGLSGRPFSRAVLQAALDAGAAGQGVPPSVPAALFAASGEVADACRAVRVVAGAWQFVEDARSRTQESFSKHFPFPAPDEPDSLPPLDALLSCVQATCKLWGILDSFMTSWKAELSGICATTAGPTIPHLADALQLSGLKFANFCRENALNWSAAASELRVRTLKTLDALDSLSWAAGVMRALGAMLDSLDKLGKDADEAWKLSSALEAIPPGTTDWEAREPVAALVIHFLKTPKPIGLEDLTPPIDFAFTLGFHKMFCLGKFDSALTDPPPAGRNPAFITVKTPVPAAAGGNGSDTEELAREAATTKAQAETEKKAREAARAKAQAETDKKAREAARAEAQAETEKKAREAAAANSEAEENAREAARAEAQAEAEEQARVAARAEAQAEEKAREAARAKAQAEAEEQARVAARAEAQAEAEEKARETARAEGLAQAQAQAAREAARAKAQAEVEALAREAARAKAQAEAEAEELAREAARAKAQGEAEELAAREAARAEARAEAEERAREAARAKGLAQAQVQAAREAARAKAQAEVEELAREAARAKAQAEAEEKAREAARAKAQAVAEAEELAREAARAEAEAEELAREAARAEAEAEGKAKEAARAKAQAEAEEKAREAAAAKSEEKAREAAAAKAEEKAREAASAKALAEAEEKGRKPPEKMSEAEELFQKYIREVANQKARDGARAQAQAQAEMEKQAREAYRKKAEAEKKAREAARTKAQAETLAEEFAMAKAEAETLARESAMVEAVAEKLARESAMAEAEAEKLASEAAGAEAEAETTEQTREAPRTEDGPEAAGPAPEVSGPAPEPDSPRASDPSDGDLVSEEEGNAEATEKPVKDGEDGGVDEREDGEGMDGEDDGEADEDGDDGEETVDREEEPEEGIDLELALLLETEAPYSRGTDPFRVFWDLSPEELAGLVLEKFGDLLAEPAPAAGNAGKGAGSFKFEDFRTSIALLPSEDGADGAGPLAPGGAAALPGGAQPPEAWLAASVGAQAAAAAMHDPGYPLLYPAGAGEADAAFEERVRRRDFRRHLAALCRKLAGLGDTRPLYWLACASPPGVFPPAAARLMHAGLNFRPGPPAAREAFAEAHDSLVTAAGPEPKRVPGDPEPWLFLYASILRPCVSCPDPAMADAATYVSRMAPECLLGLAEDLSKLPLRIGTRDAVKALKLISDVRGRDRRLERLEARTERFMEEMPKRSTAYPPADHIWKDIFSPPKGELSILLDKCRSEQLTATTAKKLRSEANALRSKQVVRDMVNRHDTRPGRRDEINASAFASIANFFALTADLACEWLDFWNSAKASEEPSWSAKLLDGVFSEAGKALLALSSPAVCGTRDRERDLAQALNWERDLAQNRDKDLAQAQNRERDLAQNRERDQALNRDLAQNRDGDQAQLKDKGRDQAQNRDREADGADAGQPDREGGLPEDGLRILTRELAALADASFLDDWEVPRRSASGKEGYFADDPEADLASWLVLCPGTTSSGGTPSAPLAGVLEVLAAGPQDAASEDRAFAERVASGESLVPAMFLDAVEGAADRREEGDHGCTFRELADRAAMVRADAAESDLEDALDAAWGAYDSGTLDAGGLRGLATDVESSLARLRCAPSGGLARAAASSQATADEAVRKVRELKDTATSAVNDRLERLRKELGGKYRATAVAVKWLLKEGETDAASDILTEAAHRAACSSRRHMSIRDGRDRSIVEDFARIAAAMKNSPDPFGAAMDAWSAAKGTSPAAAMHSSGLAEQLWGRLEAASGESGSAEDVREELEALLRWFGFKAGKNFSAVPGKCGGDPFPWREYLVETACYPPVPAWGGGILGKISAMVWNGKGATPEHLTDALESWSPDPGTLVLVVALAALTPGARGHLWTWARAAARDMVVLDTCLMATVAAAAPAKMQHYRPNWLYEAGGIYGAFRPFGEGQLRWGGPGRDDLVRELAQERGVVRLQGPPGIGKSSVLSLLAADPSVNKPADGNYCFMVDYSSLDPAWIAVLGPLGAVMDRAVRPGTAGQETGGSGTAGPGASGPAGRDAEGSDTAGGKAEVPEAGGHATGGRTDAASRDAGSDAKSSGAAASGTGGSGAVPSGKKGSATIASGQKGPGSSGSCHLPGWEPSESVAANLTAMTAHVPRKGCPKQITVICDNADAFLNDLMASPPDLETFVSLAVKPGPLKVVLAGRRVTFRAECHPASPLSALREPFYLRATEPAAAASMLSDQVAACGWTFASPGLPYRMAARCGWNPGSMAALGRSVIDLATSELDPDVPPPFLITENAVTRSLQDPATRDAMKDIALAELSQDTRYSAVVLAMAYMCHTDDAEFPGSGMSARSLLAHLRELCPAPFGPGSGPSVDMLTDELVRSGMLSLDSRGPRFRTEAHLRLMGDQDSILDDLTALKDLKAPPGAELLECRRLMSPLPASRPKTPAPVFLPFHTGRELGGTALPDWLTDGSPQAVFAGTVLGIPYLEQSAGLLDGNGEDGGTDLTGLHGHGPSGSAGSPGQAGPAGNAGHGGDDGQTCAAVNAGQAGVNGQKGTAGEAGQARGNGQAGAEAAAERSGAGDGGGSSESHPFPGRIAAGGREFCIYSPDIPAGCTADRSGSGIDELAVAEISDLSGLPFYSETSVSGMPAERRAGVPLPSPFTIAEECAMFSRTRPSRMTVGLIPVSGLARAWEAVKSLCGMTVLSGAAGSACFEIRPGTGDTWEKAAELVERARAATKPTRRLHVAWLSLSEAGKGPHADFAAAALAAGEGTVRTVRGQQAALTCLCPPEMLLAWTPETREDSALYASRWTEPAVRLYLAECGLAPSKAGAIVMSTGGWDSLVLTDVLTSCGFPLKPLSPETFLNGVPVQLRNLIDELRGLKLFTMEHAADSYASREPGGSRESVRDWLALLENLAVLVPAEKKGNDTIWKVDPRFA